MSESPRPFRLFDVWRRRSDDSVRSEPADVGTAFGLELSMLPDDVPAAAGGCQPPGTGWWRRLSQWAGG